jgi:mannitol-1-/sugar-/sorbitol-6-phosphatase
MSVTVFDCDAVLFDMDGTLVDSRYIVERMWILWATEQGLSVEAALALAHGRRTLETMELLAPHLATPEEAARLDALEAEQEGGETAMPGASDLPSALPAHRWAVVTSAARVLASRRIGSVGLPGPLVLVSADDVVAGKPSPEGYLKAAYSLAHTAVTCASDPHGLRWNRNGLFLLIHVAHSRARPSAGSSACARRRNSASASGRANAR